MLDPEAFAEDPYCWEDGVLWKLSVLGIHGVASTTGSLDFFNCWISLKRLMLARDCSSICSCIRFIKLNISLLKIAGSRDSGLDHGCIGRSGLLAGFPEGLPEGFPEGFPTGFPTGFGGAGRLL